MGEFEVKVGLDDRKLGSDEWVIDVGGVEAGKRLGGTLVVALLDEPSRRLGENQEEEAENDGPNELDTDGDTPRAGVVSLLGAVGSEGSAKETDGDGPLVTGNDGTTDPTRSGLGLVHGDNGGQNTDAHTGNNTTADKNTEVGGGHLHDDTGAEDSESDLHAPSSTENVRDRSTGKGTDESTGRENRDNERGVAGAQIPAWLGRAKIGVGGDVDGVELTKGLLEVLHDQKTRDCTRVVAVEDTTESGSRSDQDGGQRLPDGCGACHRHVGGGVADHIGGHSTSRHLGKNGGVEEKGGGGGGGGGS